MKTAILVELGDITKFAGDAIVNAANQTLLGGGGVDGAIHDAAGPLLLEACRGLPELSPSRRCPVGECRITPGFQLPARFVIHTVGPIWLGGDQDESRLLADCYRHSIELADEHDCQTIAMPAISCGAFGYPWEQAAIVANDAILAALPHCSNVTSVSIVLFNRDIFRVWKTLFDYNIH